MSNSVSASTMALLNGLDEYSDLIKPQSRGRGGRGPWPPATTVESNTVRSFEGMVRVTGITIDEAGEKKFYVGGGVKDPVVLPALTLRIGYEWMDWPQQRDAVVAQHPEYESWDGTFSSDLYYIVDRKKIPTHNSTKAPDLLRSNFDDQLGRLRNNIAKLVGVPDLPLSQLVNQAIQMDGLAKSNTLLVDLRCEIKTTQQKDKTKDPYVDRYDYIQTRHTVATT